MKLNNFVRIHLSVDPFSMVCVCVCVLSLTNRVWLCFGFRNVFLNCIFKDLFWSIVLFHELCMRRFSCVWFLTYDFLSSVLKLFPLHFECFAHCYLLCPLLCFLQSLLPCTHSISIFSYFVLHHFLNSASSHFSSSCLLAISSLSYFCFVIFRHREIAWFDF